MFNHVPTKVKSRFALTRIKLTSAAVVLIAIPAAAATGSPPCALRPELLKQYSKQLNEQPVALDLTNNGSLIEVLTSDGGSTWTIMISQPNGSSCLVAAGARLKHAAKGERGA
jgi:hypothetical protein